MENFEEAPEGLVIPLFEVAAEPILPVFDRPTGTTFEPQPEDEVLAEAWATIMTHLGYEPEYICPNDLLH